MFHGLDGKPLRKAPKRRVAAVRWTAGALKDLSGGQDMAYVEQNKSANKLAKKNVPHNPFFKSMMRANEKRRNLG